MFYFSAEASRLLDDVIIKSVIRFGVADNNDVATIYIDRISFSRTVPVRRTETEFLPSMGYEMCLPSRIV